MAHSKKEAGFWAAVVAEAQLGAEPHSAIAAKHGVTEAALKCHLYKVQRAGTPSPASATGGEAASTAASC